jgi:hypothetical protein
MDLMRNFLIVSLLVMVLAPRLVLATESHPLMPSALAVAPQAEFTRFGFSIYRAQLWAPEGQFKKDAPFALSLTYSRDIAGERILDASLKEMKKLGAPVDQSPQWREQLARVLPDVKQGDTLTGVYTPSQGAEFFYQNQKTGTLDDELAAFFFAIWLDPRTSEPDLRRSLLGEKK